METPIKREYKHGGIVKLSPNVKPSYSTVDTEIMADVAEEDQKHMGMVIDYCSTTICKKHEDIKVFIYTSRDEKTNEILLYTLYVGVPMTTVLSDDHFTRIKEFSWVRITRPIKYEHDPEFNLMRFEISINPSCNLPAIDDICIHSITNIHLRQKRNRLNIIHENEGDDDERGSTKRPRK